MIADTLALTPAGPVCLKAAHCSNLPRENLNWANLSKLLLAMALQTIIQNKKAPLLAQRFINLIYVVMRFSRDYSRIPALTPAGPVCLKTAHCSNLLRANLSKLLLAMALQTAIQNKKAPLIAQRFINLIYVVMCLRRDYSRIPALTPAGPVCLKAAHCSNLLPANLSNIGFSSWPFSPSYTIKRPPPLSQRGPFYCIWRTGRDSNPRPPA